MMAVSRSVLFFLLLLPCALQAQTRDSTHFNKRRLTGFVAVSAAVYTLSLAGLHHVWYRDNPQQSFRFFNDHAEWKQVDKVGHFYSAFYLSYSTAAALRWCAVKPAKADLIGSLVGFGVMLPIEILDGFSTAYGASSGDLLANAGGAAFYLGQTLLWDGIRIYPKYSFHQTHYAPVRPKILGNDLPSELFKDYNGQTYWLSVDMDKFMRFPKWLNLAVGYGAEGMIYARDSQNAEAGYALPYRQYYLSIDFDLRAIKSNSKFVNTLIFVASMIKLPAPTIEFSNKGAKFRPFYF